MRQRLIERAPGLFHESESAHRRDHVLEVQLPMLQYTLHPGFSILPLLFGQNPPGTYRQCAEHLLAIISDADLLIASSDLSHYPAYRDAQLIDRQTLDFMVKLDLDGLERHERKTMQCGLPGLETPFCGPDAIRTVLEIARRKRWTGKLPDCHNSGDSELGDRTSVVGYGAIMFTGR